MTTFTIYQLNRNNANYRAKSYASLDFLKSCDLSVDINEYNNVYEGEIEEGKNDLATCEKVFAKFNMSRPSDFKGHSLSVSDIVKIGENLYYCDDYGFEKIA